MSTLFQIVIQQEQTHVPITVFLVAGAIDASSYELLEDAAADAFEQGTRRLLLDLSGVAYMGSAGLRALYAIDRMLRQAADDAAGGAGDSGLINDSFRSPFLKLLNPTRSVNHTLKISGFEMAFDIFDDRQMALDSF